VWTRRPGLPGAVRAGRPTDEPLALLSGTETGFLRHVHAQSRFAGGAVYVLTGAGRAARGSTAPMVAWGEVAPFDLIVVGVGRILPPQLLPVGAEIPCEGGSTTDEGVGP